MKSLDLFVKRNCVSKYVIAITLDPLPQNLINTQYAKLRPMTLKIVLEKVRLHSVLWIDLQFLVDKPLWVH